MSEKWQPICILRDRSVRFASVGRESTLKTEALAFQPIPGVTENRAKQCPISGNSNSPSGGSAWPTRETDTKRILILILASIVSVSACNSTKSGMGTGTSMQGMWTVTGNLGSQSGTETYQVSFVSSPCSVASPVGTFSVQGPFVLSPITTPDKGRSLERGCSATQVIRAREF